jgi:hypothetical protein
MPIEVMEEFAREGWIGLGWQIGRDSMHFQPTRWASSFLVSHV